MPQQPWIDPFARGDYDACYRLTRPLLGPALAPEAMQLLLISLQRLGLDAELTVAAERVLQATAARPWERGLVEVTLGERDLAQLLGEATTADRQCQLHFYAAARQATLGGDPAPLLERCRRLGSGVAEARLAEIEAARARGPGGPGSAELEVAGGLRLALSWLRRGNPGAAAGISGKALGIAVERLGGDHLQTAACLDRLGEALFGVREPRAALTCHEEALAVRLKAFGQEAPELCGSLHKIGFVQARLGRNEAALGWLAAALELGQKLVGQCHVATAGTIACLAQVLRALGEEAAARHHFELHLAICRELFGEDHPATIEAARELGPPAPAPRGATAATPDAFARAEPIAWERFGEGGPAAGARLLDLARLLRRGGDATRACFYFRRALEACRALAGDHPVTSTALVELGAQLRSMGALAEARSLLEESLDMRRRLFGEHHEATVVSLRNLGVLLGELGDRGAELECLTAEVEARRRLPGDGREELADSLEQLAILRTREAHDLAGARAAIEEALRLRRESLGAGHPRVATALAVLAVVQSQAGDRAGARSSLEQALGIRRQEAGHDPLEVAELLLSLGHEENGLELFDSAKQHLEECLAIRVPRLGETDALAASARAGLGYASLRLGQYAAAQEHLDVAQAILRSQGGGQERAAAGVLCMLGMARLRTGDYAAARRCLEESLEVRRRLLGDLHPDTAESLHDLGFLLEDIGDVPRALACYAEALGIRRRVLGPRAEPTLHTVASLGVLLKNAGRYAEARPYYEEVLAHERQLHGDDHPDTLRALSNWAAFRYTLGEREAALPDMQEAVRRGRAVARPAGFELASSLHNLGNLLTDLGEHDAARRHLDEALAAAREAHGAHAREVTTVLHGIARLEARRDRPRAALDALASAAANDDHLLGQAFWASSERQRALTLRLLLDTVHATIALVARHFPDDPALVRRAFDLLLRRKAISAEALAVQRDAVLGARHPALQPVLEALRRTRALLAQLELEGGAGAGGARDRQLAGLRAERERLESEVARAVPELSLSQRFLEADADRVAGAIPAGHALVELVRCPFSLFPVTVPEAEAMRAGGHSAHYLAFVLTPAGSGRPALVDLGEAGPIERLLAEVRTSVAGARAVPEQPRPHPVPGAGPGAAAELRALVFDPIASRVGDCRRLIIAPDGELTRLPFGILPVSTRERLVDAWHFSYLSAGRDLVRQSQPRATGLAAALVVANPNYDLAAEQPSSGPASSEAPPALREARPEALRGELARARIHFGPLAETGLEAREVAELLGVSPVLGDEATLARLRACRSPRVLHLATHGFFLEPASRPPPEAPAARLLDCDSPNPLLRSGLALAGANTWLRELPLPAGAGTGLLTAEEVTGLDLEGTELVVLSACETGLGVEDFSEGTMGLQRSFVLAGARTVVMSLWKVPDAETRELMVAFYGALRDGIGRAEALRRAQLQVQAAHPDPLCWGAFVCLGDPGPLPWRRDPSPA